MCLDEGERIDSMKRLCSNLLRLVLVATLGAGIFAVSNMYAVTQSWAASCKAMSITQCDAASKCVWVKSYKSKSGARIRAHCRDKNQSKASVLDKLFNGKESTTKITRITSKKRVNITRNPKPSEKLK